MNVSPKQPQDGSIPASQRPGGVRADAPHSSEPLPPTLFALPNLRSQGTKVPTAEKPTSNPSLHSADSKPFATPMAPERRKPFRSWRQLHSRRPHRRRRKSFATMNLRCQMQFRPVIKTVEPGYDIADPATLIDTPSKTSLLDRIGSHAIVLVMLLIVFGIALLAGRRPIIESTTPMATQPDFN